MRIVYKSSLAKTVDAVNEVFFFGHSLSKSKKGEVAKWIAKRQGKSGSYANMFAPTDKDFRDGIRLFTGERVRSGAATAHILGEEACRALILLSINTAGVQKSLSNANNGMMERIKISEGKGRVRGTYCCGTCTSSYWRHLAVGGLKNAERELQAGIKNLKLHRDRSGRWRKYPFYYTLLALSEINLPSAVKEMQYASRLCESLLKRRPKRDKYSQRRRFLAEKILLKC